MERVRLSLLLLLLLAAAPGPGAAGQGLRADVRFASGRGISADVADTPAGRQRGLMFRKTLAPDYGMLFVFPFEADMSFWMKNTWVSLDIVFIGRDKRITRVHERVRPSTDKTTDEAVARVHGLAQYVLELPAGAARRYKLRAGQGVEFSARIPER
ncbi:MAG: DUF192 domain-containing protein [Elusimicrobiota bacterium]|jgi:hypothetical protein